MSAAPLPSSADLARYLEARGELGKPWMWQLLRLAKLKESKDSLPPEEYLERLRKAKDKAEFDQFMADRRRPMAPQDPGQGA